MKKKNNRLLSLLLLLLCHVSLSAQTVTIYRGGVPLVPTYSTVAAAIGASINGDTLKLSAHTFNEHDLYVNKNISLLGTMTSTDTSIIDARKLGRVLRLGYGKTLTIKDIQIVNGFVAGSGGGIQIDTNAVLSLSGYTTVANNEAGLNGGAIYGTELPMGSDTIALKMSNNVVVKNNKSKVCTIHITNDVPHGRVYLSDDVQIINNEGTGVNTDILTVYGTGKEGGVRIQRNHTTDTLRGGGGMNLHYLYLYGTLTVSNNRSDSFGGGVGNINNLYGNGKLLVTNNTAKYGGGGMYGFGFGGDSATVIYSNNHAVYGGGLYLDNFYGTVPGLTNNKNLEISNNTADSLGGAIYIKGSTRPGYVGNMTFYKVNMYNNKAWRYNGVYVINNFTTNFLKCRFFNPDLSGAHTNEVYINNNVFFQSDSCWFGESDTTGLMIKDASSAIALNRYVQCDWRVNNGAPIVALPFPVSAQFRLSTGASLPSYSFMMLQGRYSGTMGSFSPALASITSTGKVESIFTASGTGTANIMGIVDADTFKANVSVKLGLMDPSLAQLRIYPNPTQSILYIEGLPASCTLVLFDMLGKQVVQKVINESGVTQLDLAGLASGNYVVQISSSDGLLGTATISKP